MTNTKRAYNWVWNSGCWLYGEPNHGCSIYTQPRGWYAKIFVGKKSVEPISKLGPFNDLDEAKEEAVAEFLKQANKNV